jgi:oligopeptide transport system permease protein
MLLNKKNAQVVENFGEQLEVEGRSEPVCP